MFDDGLKHQAVPPLATKYNLLSKAKKILVAPLNWGLGHATRCMPIIQELERQGAEVILAADGRARDLLQAEFPEKEVLELPAYKVHYRTSNMFLNIAPQLPKIAWAVRQEQRVVEQWVDKYDLDGIISDNRFGCFSKRIPSVFMTHQVCIKMPFRWLENLVMRVNLGFIRRFDSCWIPDFPDEPSLSGVLSHDVPLQNGVYIGALSRMKKLDVPQKYDLIVVLSGPEPQRTYLEEKLSQQLVALKYKTLIVQGKTATFEEVQLTPYVTRVSFLTAKKLNEAMSAAKVVISRSGYSTLMDLAALGKQAILIPTPGQTEQEYLAQHFKAQGIFDFCTQQELNVENIVSNVENYTGWQSDKTAHHLLSTAIAVFLAKIK